MAYLNVQNLVKVVSEGLIRSRSNLAYNAASAKFGRIKKNLIKEFDNHPVTREIKEAENASNPGSVSNSSGLLAGTRGPMNDGEGQANLFTFLGFTLGRKPTEQVRAILDELNIGKEIAQTRIVRDGVIFSFNIVGDEEIEDRIINNSKMEWENGNSWVVGITEGVSGFSNYIYWRRILNNAAKSRSTAGTQASNALRSASMKTTDYLMKMVENFRKEM